MLTRICSPRYTLPCHILLITKSAHLSPNFCLFRFYDPKATKSLGWLAGYSSDSRSVLRITIGLPDSILIGIYIVLSTRFRKGPCSPWCSSCMNRLALLLRHQTAPITYDVYCSCTFFVFLTELLCTGISGLPCLFQSCSKGGSLIDDMLYVCYVIFVYNLKFCFLVYVSGFMFGVL